MTISKAIIVSILIGLIVFSERLFPFVLFSKYQPGKLIRIFEHFIPPLVMTGLLIYSLRDIRFTSPEQWVPQISAIAFTIATYLWRKNSLISIFGGTIIYMILIRVMWSVSNFSRFHLKGFTTASLSSSNSKTGQSLFFIIYSNITKKNNKHNHNEWKNYLLKNNPLIPYKTKTLLFYHQKSHYLRLYSS